MVDYKNAVFFSVVIPTYNRREPIKSSIESILKQNFGSFEIIIVDDGSTDGTYEALQADYSSNSQIQIIKQENKERGAARNTGFNHAQGIYVEFLDSDDILLEGHFNLLHDKVLELNYPDFICSKFQLFRDGRSYDGDIQKFKEGFYDYKIFLKGNPLACNICVRRDNKDLKLFEEDRSYSIKEDWMFMLQNLRNSKVYIIDKVTIRMSDHDDRSMRSDNKLIVQRTFKAQKWILQNVALDTSEKRKLKAHTYYFSGIHSYIDNERKEAFRYLMGSIRLEGIQKKYLVLLMKIMIGKRTTNLFKRILN